MKPYDLLYIMSHGNRQLVVMREGTFFPSAISLVPPGDTACRIDIFVML